MSTNLDFNKNPSGASPKDYASDLLFWLGMVDSTPEEVTAMRGSRSPYGTWTPDLRIDRSEVEAVYANSSRPVDSVVRAVRHCREEDWDLLTKLVKSTTAGSVLMYAAARSGMPSEYYDAVVSRLGLTSLSPSNKASVASALGAGAPLSYLKENVEEILSYADVSVFADALADRFLMFCSDDDLSDLQSLMGLVADSRVGHSSQAVSALLAFLEAASLAGHDTDMHLEVLRGYCSPDTDFRVAKVVRTAICRFAAGLSIGFWPTASALVDSSSRDERKSFAALRPRRDRIELSPKWVKALSESSEALKASGFRDPFSVERWSVIPRGGAYSRSRSPVEHEPIVEGSRRIPVRISSAAAPVIRELAAVRNRVHPEYLAALCAHESDDAVRGATARIIDLLLDDAAAADEDRSRRLVTVAAAALTFTIRALSESSSVEKWMPQLDAVMSKFRTLYASGAVFIPHVVSSVPWPATVNGASVVSHYSLESLELIAASMSPSENVRTMSAVGVAAQSGPSNSNEHLQAEWLSRLGGSSAGPWYVCAAYARDIVAGRIAVGSLLDLLQASGEQELPPESRRQDCPAIEHFVRVAARLVTRAVRDGARMPPPAMELLVDVLITLGVNSGDSLLGVYPAGSARDAVTMGPEPLEFALSFGRLLNRHLDGVDLGSRQEYLSSALSAVSNDRTLLFTERLSAIIETLTGRPPLEDDDWYGGAVGFDDTVDGEPTASCPPKRRARRRRAGCSGQLELPI